MKGEICIVVPFPLKNMISLTGKPDYTSCSYTYSYVHISCSLCADAHYQDISADKTPPVRKEERRQGN